MSLNAPDAIEELVGVRAWRFVRGRLWSLYRPVAWMPGQPVSAECLTAQRPGTFKLVPPPAHRAPSVMCRCGLYAAFWSPQQAGEGEGLEHMFGTVLGLPSALEEGYVLGEVSGWGLTELYTKGFRSEWQSVRAIYATGEDSGTAADTYDVPLVSV